ncbi:MAG: DUF3568 family protein [Nitrospirae bacterium]|nr:DUF3568 family protein [Nitrospirota bacterium]
MRIIRLMALFLSLTFLWGCELALIGAGAGIGAGAYKIIEGNISKDYPIAYKKAWEATNSAFEKLTISITNSIDEGVKGQIEAVRKDGTQVFVNLKDRGQGVTSISVRVGGFGNRSDAERIHEEIANVAGIK